MKKILICIFAVFIFLRFLPESVESKNLVSIEEIPNNSSLETSHIIHIIYNLQIDNLDTQEFNLIYLKKKPFLFHLSDEFDDNDISLLNFSHGVSDSSIDFGEYYLIIKDVDNNIVYKQDVVLDNYNTVEISLNVDVNIHSFEVESCLKKNQHNPIDCYRLYKEKF